MIGSCLCGEVQFRLAQPLPALYQCHCSLCRKVSGPASNSATLVVARSFTWECGSDSITRYATETGFRSDFCCKCVSRLPNETADGRHYWVPVGLLEPCAELEVALHVYVDSKASWHTIGGVARQHAQMPMDNVLHDILQRR